MSKYELSISTNYVKEWTIVEAVRELFQNGIDEELVNSDHKFEWRYDESSEELSFRNCNTGLDIRTLLMGSTSKSDSSETIGLYGEGYKLATVVSLRTGHPIIFYNNKNNEIWEPKLVNSRRYKGEKIPTFFTRKNSTSDNDLIIIISNITVDEFKEIKKYNLNFRDDYPGYLGTSKGNIITSQNEKGNIYVSGLYICHNNGIDCGYDFNPNVVKLDRDRKLVSDFDIKWNASDMWSEAQKYGDRDEDFKKSFIEKTIDKREVVYISNFLDNTARDIIVEDFILMNGEDTIPIPEGKSAEYEEVIKNNKTVIVKDCVYDILSSSHNYKIPEPKFYDNEETISNMLEEFYKDVRYMLNNRQKMKLKDICNRVYTKLGYPDNYEEK